MKFLLESASLGKKDFGVAYKQSKVCMHSTNSKLNEHFLIEDTVDVIKLKQATQPNWITDDNLNEYVNKYILSMPQQKVIEMAELELKDSFVEGPMFILPNGKLIDPADYAEFEGFEREDAIHQVVSLYLCDMIFDKLEMDFERDYGYYYDDYFLAQLTETFGWVRVNTGTGSTDFRCYVVIPSKDKARLSSSQYYKLLDWLDYCQILNKESVAIVTESGDKQNYSLKEYTSDEIIAKIKRYYTSGRLYESEEKYYKPKIDQAIEVGDLKEELTDEPTLGPSWITKDGKFVKLDKDTQHDDYKEYKRIKSNIKVNAGNRFEHFPYIHIYKEPTKEQCNAIKEWLENVFYFGEFEKKLIVYVEYKDDVFEYKLDEDTWKDVIKDIKSKNMYGGKLYESLSKMEQ